ANVLRLQAEAGVGLDVDLPVAVEAGEVVDVGRAEVRLQGREDLPQIDLHRLDLDPIHFEVDLRLVGGVAAEQAGQPSALPVARRGQGLHAPFQGDGARPAAVLYLELEPARATQAVHGRRPEDSHPGLADFLQEALAQCFHDFAGTDRKSTRLNSSH